jgi:hypothetical protein
MRICVRLFAAGLMTAGVTGLAAESPALAATYTVLAVPGSTATGPSAINLSGSVAGDYVDGSGIQHGFVWVNGTYATFDPAGSTETFVTGINDSGTITGIWLDSSRDKHGFIRSAAGSIASFDAATGTRSTEVFSINNQGAVGGNYVGTAGDEGFIRTASGQIIAFTAPGAAGTTEQTSTTTTQQPVITLIQWPCPTATYERRTAPSRSSMQCMPEWGRIRAHLRTPSTTAALLREISSIATTSTTATFGHPAA